MGTRESVGDMPDYSRWADELASELSDDDSGDDPSSRFANPGIVDSNRQSDSQDIGEETSKDGVGGTNPEWKNADRVGQQVYEGDTIVTEIDISIVKETPTREKVDWNGLVAKVAHDGEFYRIAMGPTEKIRAAANNLRTKQNQKVAGFENYEFMTRKVKGSESDENQDGVAKLYARYNVDNV